MTTYEGLTCTAVDGLLTIRLGREHGNALNGGLLRSLAAAMRAADSDPGVRGVLLASSGKIFCPGLDLQELTRLDREAMRGVMMAMSEALLSMLRLSRPLVAALHGHALAGGCVIALPADWRVLKRDALIGLNELKVGVPLPYGVTRLVQAEVPPSHVTDVALVGRNFQNEAALTAGLAHEIHAGDDVEAQALSRLADLASRDGTAFAATKKYLRAALVADIEAGDARAAGEFLDCWFSAPTRQRVEAIVAGLKPRG